MPDPTPAEIAAAIAERDKWPSDLSALARMANDWVATNASYGDDLAAHVYLWHKAQLAQARAEALEQAKQACRKVAADYPIDVFPDDGDSLDCKSARMARLTAKNCIDGIDALNKDAALAQANGNTSEARG